MNFNENLKEIRKEKGLTQKDIYTILNLSANGYASWEQGRTEPNIESIKRLCIILNVTADYLLGLENYDGTKIEKSILSSFNGNNNTNNINIR